jgi:hypothetical protein
MHSSDSLSAVLTFVLLYRTLVPGNCDSYSFSIVDGNLKGSFSITSFGGVWSQEWNIDVGELHDLVIDVFEGSRSSSLSGRHPQRTGIFPRRPSIRCSEL